jgi:activator of HSP90 ATPase
MQIRDVATQAAIRPTRREALVGAAAALGGIALAARPLPIAGDEISKSEESIHQETLFKAPCRRVFELLTDAKQFDRVVRLSDAMKSAKVPNSVATALSGEAGGPFTLFGGHIVGRNVELVPDQRLVQAWRVADWKAGLYSIARFELVAQGEETKLVFDHTGFPKGQADHLAAGWKANYWEPMAKALA